jgi:hypothetical protein
MMLSGNSVFWIFELTCPSRFSDPLGFASRRAIAFASSLSQVFGGGGRPCPASIGQLVVSRVMRLSEGHIRTLVQEVFDFALERMRADGFPDDDIKNLRSASLHWLRHTSATADAKVRDHKDLQADLRHQSLATTVDTYYNSRDEERHRSNKYLVIEDR